MRINRRTQMGSNYPNRDLRSALTLRPRDVFVLYGVPPSTLADLCRHPDPEKRMPSILLPGARGRRGITLIDHGRFRAWLAKWSNCETPPHQAEKELHTVRGCGSGYPVPPGGSAFSALTDNHAPHGATGETPADAFGPSQAVTSAPAISEESLEGFIDGWLAVRKRVAAPKTLLNIVSVVGDFREWFGDRWQTCQLSGVTSRDIAEFRGYELARGKAPTTVNKEISFFQQLFEEAVAQGLVTRNPVRGLRLKRAKQYAQKRCAFSFRQFQELVRRTHPNERGTHGGHTHPDWQSFIVVCGYTGGRQQEVAQLRWGMVDFSKGTLGLARSKSGGDIHHLPMHPSLREHLSKLAQKSGPKCDSAFVMPGFAGTQGRYLSKAFRELILPRIGIVQPYAPKSQPGAVGRRLAKYSLHSLRHSLATWLNEAGVSDAIRMEIVGHEDEDVSRGYTHTDLETARIQLAKVPHL